MHIDTASASNSLHPLRLTSNRGAANSTEPTKHELAPSPNASSMASSRAADVSAVMRGLGDQGGLPCSMPPGMSGSQGDRNLPDWPTIQGSDDDLTGSAPVVEGEPPIEPSAQQDVTVLDIIGSWDTNNPQFDFTGDGMVDIHDLLHFIRSQSPVSCPGPAPDKHTGTSDIATTDLVDSTTSLDAVADAPGQSNSTSDTASADRIKWQNSAYNSDVIASHEPYTQPFAVQPIEVRAQKLVDSLIARLNENGFDQQPPTNIRELVDQLNLRPAQMNFVMHRLGEHYPMGLGVNLKG